MDLSGAFGKAEPAKRREKLRQRGQAGGAEQKPAQKGKREREEGHVNEGMRPAPVVPQILQPAGEKQEVEVGKSGGDRAQKKRRPRARPLGDGAGEEGAGDGVG